MTRQLLDAVEYLLSAILVIVLAPVGFIISVVILIDSGRPVFFRPRRVGRNGRVFRLFLFRTMIAQQSDSGLTWQRTRLGKFLSTCAIDEWPQLLNILAGQMTLVGPRPENPDFLDKCGEDYRQVGSRKPGMCGSIGFTLFDERSMLGFATDRQSTYLREILPVKVSSDLQFVRTCTPGAAAKTIILCTLQFARLIAQRLPFEMRIIPKMGVDVCVVTLSTLLVHFVRLGTVAGDEHLARTLALLLPLIVLRIGTLWVLGCYRTFWRYTGGRDIFRVVLATMMSSTMFGAILYFFNWGPTTYPRSIFVFEWMFTTLGLMVVRLVVAQGAVLVKGRMLGPGKASRVLIYGGGDAGAALAASLLAEPGERYPVAFIDDNPAKQGALLHGVPIIGTGSCIMELVRAKSIDEIIIAMPSATSEQMRRIIFRCEDLPCRLATLPSIGEILAGQRMDRVRSVKVEDLLERKPARVDMDAIAYLLAGQRVLITGAGGSIGSELCRQIVSFNPECLVLLGHGENSVFEIEQELKEACGFKAVAVIADIQDRRKLEQVFDRYRPNMIFHAAAHKHVPLMETNPEEAIKNNVIGTLNLAELAVEYEVAHFVMVSSDKAVNPTSVMGATKRVAEMIIQVMGCDETIKTRFNTVRFGNVLGSRGSLIPILRRQIARGGPITITHPDMTRYFMTIPEAVQLMLQASAVGGQGQILVLDMGEPVKIVDLARNLVRLSGLVPNKDIKIVYTGIREGEKLFEEVLTDAENATRSRLEHVFISRPTSVDPAALSSAIARLEAAAMTGDQAAIRDTLKDLVPSFCTKAPSFEAVGASEQGHTSGG